MVLGAQPQPTWRLLTSMALKALMNPTDRFRRQLSNLKALMTSDTLDPSLINVPVKYDEQKARDPLPTHLNRPHERLPSMGKKHKPRSSGNKTSGNKIIRHTTT